MQILNKTTIFLYPSRVTPGCGKLTSHGETKDICNARKISPYRLPKKHVPYHEGSIPNLSLHLARRK